MTSTTAVAASPANKGGFWIRVVAYIIDAIVLGVVGTIIGGFLDPDPAAPSRTSLNLLLGLVYFLYFWSAQGGGQTLGMRVFNLKVVRTDGSALTVVQAIIRYVGLVVSFVVVFIGVIWVAFDANKQGWHDKIADTYVVKTK